MTEKRNPTATAEEKEGSYRTLRGALSACVLVFSVCFSIFHFYFTGFAFMEAMKMRSIHVAGILSLIFLYYPATKRSPRQMPSYHDFLLAGLSAFAGAYTFLQIDVIALRGGTYLVRDLVVGSIFMCLIIEATRRAVGNILVVVAAVFILYTFVGQYIPGLFGHMGFSVKRIITHLYLTTEGIFGITTGVSATYVYLFILFAAFLSKSGMGAFFNDFAIAFAGRRRGGPAKVAVLASGLMGTISGSAASNVVTTGTFTIPLMKKLGYSPRFAGAVESAASTGGQIMPPIMGAAAFIISETLGIPYIQVVKAAVLPALFYYFAIWMAVELRARKDNLQALPPELIPPLWSLLKEKGHLILPLGVIIYLLVTGYTPLYAATRCIILTVLISFLRKETRMSLRGIIEALNDGAKNSLAVAISCIVVGFVVGVASLTGIGLRIGASLLSISGGNLFITMLLTMMLSLLMGMGLPTTAAYIMVATTAVSAMTQLGVASLGAHLFVFYFAILAGITPPVAVTAYIGAGIAEAPPLETAWDSVKLALAGFIVPFMFVYSPVLLLEGGTLFYKIICILSAMLGITALATAVEGYWRRDLSWATRSALFLAAMLLIKPGGLSDLMGAGILLAIWIREWKIMKKPAPGVPVAEATRGGGFATPMRQDPDAH